MVMFLVQCLFVALNWSTQVYLRKKLEGSTQIQENMNWKWPHSEHCFPAPSSKLSQIWLCHWMGTLYLHAAVHPCGQCHPKGLGTNQTPSIGLWHPSFKEGAGSDAWSVGINMTGSSLALKHPRKHEMHPPRVKEKKERNKTSVSIQTIVVLFVLV